MNTSHQIDPDSRNRLLSCLSLAIDETKLVKSIIESRDMAYELETRNPKSHRLRFLSREISHLEKKLAEVRSQATRQ